MPLTNIYKSIRKGDIRINGLKVKQNSRVNSGDILYIYKQFLAHTRDESKQQSNENLNKNRIIYSNDNLLFYNKERGRLVHGDKNSLDRIVQDYLKNEVESLSFTPGPLHRLDRNTYGIVAFSKSLQGARKFTSMLQNGEVRKFYIAIVDGTFKSSEIWNDRITRDSSTLKSSLSSDGQSATSIFTPLISRKNRTLAMIEIKSGRTHQIRVQCSSHGRPLTGDYKYNSDKKYNKYFLAAISLMFTKESDIIDKSVIEIPIESFKNTLLNEIFTVEDIVSAKKILQKELHKR